MGLVDYSESDSSGSEAEAPVKHITKAKPATSSKKVPSVVVDKSKAGKIIVNLAGTATDAESTPTDEPPAKRARTASGGRFAGFNSFLPAPKNAAAKAAGPSLGLGLRTSAAPGFSRDTGATSTVDTDVRGGGDEEAGSAPKSSVLSLPPPKSAIAEPSIPEGQKPASEVKLTGKPLMFRPLSVAKAKKKKTTTTTTKTSTPTAASQPAPTETNPASAPAATPAPESPRKKVSLFSIPTDNAAPAPGPSLPSSSSSSGAYEPLFETCAPVTDDGGAAGAYAAEDALAAAEPAAELVGDMADDMNLSAAARRELFGRAGSGAHAARRVVNFNMDREYRHNEALRASGEQQTHNPVRAIQGGGKHSLRQLVSNVQGQKDALEDSFAKGKSNRREASSRYGW
ncbi:stress activated map kinase interacting [Cordyceps javanica]|uniref:Stress activated map kinase interacting n=1 Tax=Cordyceps javanica TaxID=43265 RepID=A0A545VF46_9HYPO|nr:stress activated map kinase interacting [Cordyceps javanica]TQW11530.1 stress activated map kinase interacting [Cordyceps javanica]